MLRIPVGHQAIWVFLNFYSTLAPEVMCRLNHGVAADYFAVGVIAYECMMGKVFQENNINNSDHIKEEQEKK